MALEGGRARFLPLVSCGRSVTLSLAFKSIKQRKEGKMCDERERKRSLTEIFSLSLLSLLSLHFHVLIQPWWLYM
jgi:hypothetical protein